MTFDEEFNRECAELRRKVDEEIRFYRFRQMPWTPYRRFHSGLEMLGAARCGRHGRSWKQVAAYVSYGTTFPGRTVICERCFEQDRTSGIHAVLREAV